MIDQQPPPLPDADPRYLKALLQAAGLKPLNPVWAKLEIVLGLAVAVVGIVVLRDRLAHDLVGGVLIVLGLYLAGAGSRSHIYQSLNMQTAYLAQVMTDAHEKGRRP